MSDATFYKWKGKLACMDVSQMRRLKDLETENSRLKRMYAASAALSKVVGDRYRSLPTERL
jgi:putative transposase